MLHASKTSEGLGPRGCPLLRSSRPEVHLAPPASFLHRIVFFTVFKFSQSAREGERASTTNMQVHSPFATPAVTAALTSRRMESALEYPLYLWQLRGFTYRRNVRIDSHVCQFFDFPYCFLGLFFFFPSMMKQTLHTFVGTMFANGVGSPVLV